MIKIRKKPTEGERDRGKKKQLIRTRKDIIINHKYIFNNIYSDDDNTNGFKMTQNNTKIPSKRKEEYI